MPADLNLQWKEYRRKTQIDISYDNYVSRFGKFWERKLKASEEEKPKFERWKKVGGTYTSHTRADTLRNELEAAGFHAERLMSGYIKPNAYTKWDLGSRALPQIVVFLPNRTLWLYTHHGTAAQGMKAAQLQNLGQNIAFVSSLEEALNAIKAVQ